jgi:hypothetical protein
MDPEWWSDKEWGEVSAEAGMVEWGGRLRQGREGERWGGRLTLGEDGYLVVGQ